MPRPKCGMRPVGGNCSRSRGTAIGYSSVAFSPDGQRIVTGSRDQTAKVWEAASGRELLTLKGHRIGIVSVAFSPDGRHIVTGCEGNTAKVWERPDGTGVLELKGHTGGDMFSGLFAGRGADRHRQQGSNGEGVGCDYRPGTAHAQRATVCGLYPSRFPLTACELLPALRSKAPRCGKPPRRPRSPSGKRRNKPPPTHSKRERIKLLTESRKPSLSN